MFDYKVQTRPFPYIRSSTIMEKDMQLKGTERLEEKTEMVPSRNLRSAAPTRNNSNIKCNFDMKVTISNVKKGSTQNKKACKILKFCILIFIIIVTIIYIYMNVRKFQLQMDELNHNIVRLAHQYDKLNRNMNRKCPYKTTHCNDFTNVIKSSDHELSNSLEVDRNNGNSKSDIYSDTYSDRAISDRAISDRVISNQAISNQAISPTWNRSTNHQASAIKIDSSTILNLMVKPSLMKPENNSIVDLNKMRYFPLNLTDLQTSETQNLATITDQTDVLRSQNKPQSKRLRRNVERANKGQQEKKGSNRRHRQSDPLVATFIGAVPEQHVNDKAKIGPWKKNNRSSNPFDFTKFHLVDDKMSIEVTISGLYMISVQIFYYGESQKCSYYVLLNSEGRFNTKRLVTCVAAACNVTGEITCHASVIAYLQKGDRLSVRQMENDRLINLREGYSHLQLVMLAKNNRKTT